MRITERRWDSWSLVNAVSLAAPSVRMVAVCAWANPDAAGEWETGHEVFPVLAIEGRLTSEFSRTRREGDAHRPATMAQMLKDGWSHDATDVNYDVIVMDGDYGLGPAATSLSGSNIAHEVVVCPWPPELDAERLAGAVGRVNQRAIENAIESSNRQKAGAVSA